MSKRFERFSTWRGLERSVAWIIRYASQLRKLVERRKNDERVDLSTSQQVKPIPLSIDELNNSENIFLKIVQRSHFEEEITDLKQPQKRKVKKSSVIHKLNPILMSDLLCIEGRLRHAPIESAAKHPVILPKQHHVAKLIVLHYHQLSAHSGLEYVLSLTRQKYWIVKGRLLVRKAINDCFGCRRRQSQVAEQRMADLPRNRVTPCKPPFICTGVDCFGPFKVRRGQNIVKRYGVIFTCLTIRAIHIEVASSLDTDSFLNAMRRFIARRGNSEEIRSDNGANFVSGEKELRDCVNDWNHDKIHQFLLLKNIKWIFNPPTTSHHGGV